LVVQPAKTHLILITDLFEGGNAVEMLERAAALVSSGVNLIVPWHSPMTVGQATIPTTPKNLPRWDVRSLPARRINFAISWRTRWRAAISRNGPQAATSRSCGRCEEHECAGHPRLSFLLFQQARRRWPGQARP
jgi:hypothetical protein